MLPLQPLFISCAYLVCDECMPSSTGHRPSSAEFSRNTSSSNSPISSKGVCVCVCTVCYICMHSHFISRDGKCRPRTLSLSRTIETVIVSQVETKNICMAPRHKLMSRGSSVVECYLFINNSII